MLSSCLYNVGFFVEVYLFDWKYIQCVDFHAYKGLQIIRILDGYYFFVIDNRFDKVNNCAMCVSLLVGGGCCLSLSPCGLLFHFLFFFSDFQAAKYKDDSRLEVHLCHSWW
jgi:hypothetical protein